MAVEKRAQNRANLPRLLVSDFAPSAGSPLGAASVAAAVFRFFRLGMDHLGGLIFVFFVSFEGSEVLLELLLGRPPAHSQGPMST